MAGPPDTLTLTRHRDLHGRRWQIWVRRSLLSLVAFEEIMEQARLQQTDSVVKIRWAVIETNGSVSFIQKQ